MRNTYQIIVLGPGGVGKSIGTNTLMVILKSLGFETSEVKPWTEAMVTTSSYVIHNFTIPANYFEQFKSPLKVVVYDLGGQFKYKEMWKLHAEDTDAIVAVVDMTRRTTLLQIPIMLPKGTMEGIPVRIIVNKADLFADFTRSTENIANQILATIQQTQSSGIVDYSVKYKGTEKFVFNGKVYRYGETISIMRQLEKDELGTVMIKISDLEALVAHAFRIAMPNITEHNSFLFGREFTLQAFDAIYQKEISAVSMLTDELIEMAHNEAPPFISWGNDPDVALPLWELKHDVITSAVNAMLIEEDSLWKMIEKLREAGYNIDVQDDTSWALTSAMLFEENPEVNYKPMHKAVLPPYFIHQMVEYSKKKDAAEEEFFV